MPNRQYRFALTGTSSVGKTSLAHALMADPRFSALVEVLIPEGARFLLTQLGYKNIDSMNVERRRDFQRRLFEWQRSQESTTRSYLADRSFVDTAAVWVERDTHDASLLLQQELPSRCRLLARRYDLLIHLPYGRIPFEPDDLRLSEPDLHMRIATRIERYLSEWNLPTITPQATLLEDRVLEVCEALRRRGFTSQG
jgi:AAA domain-containing protein